MARVEPSRSPSSDQGPQVLPLPEAMLLPDRHPQRGMSVVPALTGWLVHTNRRCNGSWTHCYQHGIPVTDLTSIPDDGTTGTTLRFMPDSALVTNTHISGCELPQLTFPTSPTGAV
jgi:topoisomerase-4 subunit B